MVALASAQPAPCLPLWVRRGGLGEEELGPQLPCKINTSCTLLVNLNIPVPFGTHIVKKKVWIQPEENFVSQTEDAAGSRDGEQEGCRSSVNGEMLRFDCCDLAISRELLRQTDRQEDRHGLDVLVPAVIL